MLAAAATAAAAAASRWALACWARALMSARVLAPVFLPPLTDVPDDARASGLETGWLLIIKGGPILESCIYRKGENRKIKCVYTITDKAHVYVITEGRGDTGTRGRGVAASSPKGARTAPNTLNGPLGYKAAINAARM